MQLAQLLRHKSLDEIVAEKEKQDREIEEKKQLEAAQA